MDPPQPPKPSVSSSFDTSMSDSAPKYVPQFSAATEMILKRINSGTSAGSLGPIGNTGLLPGYDEMRRAVMSNMKTSDNMELPVMPTITGRRNQGERASVGSASSAGATKSTNAGTPKPRGRPQTDNNGTPVSAKGRGGAKGSARGKKRKRAQEETDESSSESVAMSDLGDSSDTDDAVSLPEDNFPKVTQSGRAIVKPAQYIPAVSDTPPKKRATPSKKNQKNVENALCKRCGRGHSPSNNQIVFCDGGCGLGWHQMCHDPRISDDVVVDEETKWFCADCTAKRGVKKATPVPELPKLVSWQGGSDAEKRSYFSSLHPQQLVDLLLQATAINPSLPLFPTGPISKPPMQAYIPPHTSQSHRTKFVSHANTSNTFTRTAVATIHSHPPAPFPPSAVAASGLFTRAEANPNGAMNFIRKITPGQQSATPPPNANPSSTFTKTSSAPPTLPPQPGPPLISSFDGANDSRDSTPASPPYPKAGNGLMAKLGPDDQDMEWLDDESDFPAFSHIVYDEHVVGGGL